MLTEKQKKALVFIAEKVQLGAAPTLREICNYMGYKAVGSAQDVIAALRKKGFLENPDKQAARSFTLTQSAHDFLSSAVPQIAIEIENTLSIPCLGEVPAGHPVEAIEHSIGSLKFDTFSLPFGIPSSDMLYAVQAKGHSMIGAGIIDGDWLVVHHQSSVDVGQIVIAMLDGDATVKRLSKDQDGYFLQPENENFSPIYASDQAFDIVGRVIALQRVLSL